MTRTPASTPSSTESSLTGTILLGTAVWLGCLGAFVVLMLRAETGHISRFDTSITGRVLDLPSALQPLFDLEALLGHAGVLAVATLALTAWLLLRRAPLEAAIVFGAFLPFAATIVVKNIVQETPPDLTHPAHYHGIFTSNYGFPSGHVVGFTVLGGLAIAFALRIVPTTLLAGLLRAACVFGIATVGIARVYERAHNPSDCVAGYLISLLYLVPALLLYARFRQRSGPHS